MKKAFLKIGAMIFFVFLITSCSKKNDDADQGAGGKYYVRFKADGVQQQYKSEGRVFGGRSETPSSTTKYYNFAISGYGDETLAYPSLQIQIQDQKIVRTDTVYASSSTPFSQSFNGYHARLYYGEALTTYEKVIFYIDSDMVKVKISSVTGNDISGTFSGIVYNSQDHSKKRVITEGSFFVERN